LSIFYPDSLNGFPSFLRFNAQIWHFSRIKYICTRDPHWKQKGTRHICYRVFRPDDELAPPECSAVSFNLQVNGNSLSGTQTEVRIGESQ